MRKTVGYFKIIQTNEPTLLIYGVGCRISFAHTVENLLDIVANSPYRYIRIQFWPA